MDRGFLAPGVQIYTQNLQEPNILATLHAYAIFLEGPPCTTMNLK